MAQTLNAHPQPIQPMVQNAMFYPNSCLTATFKLQYNFNKKILFATITKKIDYFL